jgi:4-hydroxy-tetrahydrodipicolinate synthase
LPLLALGAKGVITTVGNVLPTETHHIVSFYNQGELELARQLQFKINPLVQALFVEVNPIPVKAAVSHLGFNVGSVRLPLTPEEPETLSRIVQELALFSQRG